MVPFRHERAGASWTRPPAAWRHEHRFEVRGDGTLMTDRIEFAAPFGLLGRCVERLVVTRYMTQLIARRNDWLKRTLEARQAGA